MRIFSALALLSACDGEPLSAQEAPREPLAPAPAETFRAEIADGIAALSGPAGEHVRWQAVPARLRGSGTAIADRAGRPAYLVLDDSREIVGLSGASPPVPRATEALVAQWRASGIDSDAKMSGRIALGEEDLPIEIGVPREGPLSLSLPIGLDGRLWFHDGSPMMVLDGAGGSLFLRGAITQEEVIFEPIGAWIRTGSDLRKALADGCAPDATLSFDVARPGEAQLTVTATQSVLRLTPGEPADPIERSAFTVHGERFSGPDGRKMSVWSDGSGGTCNPVFHDLDLSFDAPGLCPIARPAGGDEMFDESLPSQLATTIWRGLGEGGLDGICHPTYRQGLVAAGEAESTHDALAMEGRPCKLARSSWASSGQCRPLVSMPKPSEGDYIATVGRLVRGVRASYDPRGLSLDHPEIGQILLPPEAVPSEETKALAEAGTTDVLLDKDGRPGWLVVPVPSGVPGWWWIVAIADHAKPEIHLADAARLENPALPWHLTGEIELRHEKVAIDLVLRDGPDQVTAVGLPPGYEAAVSVDPKSLERARGITVWIWGPDGSVLLEGSLGGKPGESLPVTLAPVPGVLADRNRLLEVLGGACFDGTLEILSRGGRPTRRGLGELWPGHPMRESLERPFGLGREGWEWIPDPADISQVFMTGQIEHDIFEERDIFSSRFGGPPPEPERSTVLRTHRCGEPPDPFDSDTAKKIEVLIEDEKPGTEIWVDNEPKAHTPATLLLTPGDNHEIYAVSGRGYRMSAPMVTEDSRSICLAQDGVCDGVEQPIERSFPRFPSRGQRPR